VPTAIRDLEVTALPPRLEAPAGCDGVLALIRYHDRPIGQLLLPLSRGPIDGPCLRETIADALGPELAMARADRLLEPPAPTDRRPASVAICTRDRPDDLSRCLDALLLLPDDGQEILVVDSASAGDETRAVVAARPPVRYLREPLPGLDRARNRALREARHDVVAFTDDDAVPDRGWLRSLVGGFTDRRVMAVTGLTLPLELETEAQEWFERTNGFGRGFARQVYDGTRVDPFLVGRIGAGVNLALRRDVLALVGAFDEALDAGTPTHSGGDHDLFSRVLMAGFTIAYEPSAVSRHRHRRDWASLRRTVFGYGVGVYAHLTKHLMRRELGALRISLGWLRHQTAGLVRAALRRPGAPPFDLAAAELLGCAAGPWALLRSRARLRRESAAAR